MYSEQSDLELVREQFDWESGRPVPTNTLMFSLTKNQDGLGMSDGLKTSSVASIQLDNLQTFGTVNPETLKEFDFSFDPGSIQVFHNEIDGLQNLIFPEPRGRNQNFFLRKDDFEFAPNDDIYRIKFEEGK